MNGRNNVKSCVQQHKRWEKMVIAAGRDYRGRKNEIGGCVNG